MGRKYAAMLGMIGYLTVTIRSVIYNGSIEGTMKSACLSLVLFGVIGLIIGQIAEQTVKESVRAEIEAEWKDLKDQRKPAT